MVLDGPQTSANPRPQRARLALYTLSKRHASAQRAILVENTLFLGGLYISFLAFVRFGLSS